MSRCYLVFLSVFLLGNAAAPARFEKWITYIEQSIANHHLEKTTNALIEDDQRYIVFKLQALTRLYKKEAPEFDAMHKSFKKLEDALGEYGKWAGLHEKSPDQFKRAKRIQAKKVLSDILKTEEYVASYRRPTRLQQFRKFLQSYEWKQYLVDRSTVLQKLQKHIQSILDGTYDLRFLEAEGGLHQLRRELRWFLIYAQALDGLVVLRQQEECPIVEDKYSSLPHSAKEMRPVDLSPCAYLKLVSVVRELGDIKDEAELENSRVKTHNDKLSDEQYERVLDIIEPLESESILKILLQDLEV